MCKRIILLMMPKWQKYKEKKRFPNTKKRVENMACSTVFLMNFKVQTLSWLFGEGENGEIKS